MRQDHPALLAAFLQGGRTASIPARHDRLPGLRVALVAHHHPSRLVPLQRRLCAPGGQLSRRIPLPASPLPAHLGNLRCSMRLGERPEGRPRLNGLQLLGVAHQHHLGPGPLRRRQHPLHLPRSNHPRLVDHQHVARGQKLPLLPPSVLQAGDGPRGDGGAALQVLRCDPRQGSAPNGVALRLPRLARDPQHRRLARAGVTDHQRQVRAFGDMGQRVALLLSEHQAAGPCGGGAFSLVERRRPDPMP